MMNSLTKILINTNDSISTIPLRLIAGMIFVAHGGQKLFAWFGGYGLEGTGQWMESIGLAPGFIMALLAGGAEFFGGILLILGFLTRPASMMLAFTMTIAIFSVHFENGLFINNNGYEYSLSLLAITLALLIQGGGMLSLDAKLKRKLS